MNIIFTTEITSKTRLFADSQLESFLLSPDVEEVHIGQVSFIYVYRKLIAEGKLNPSDHDLSIDGIVYQVSCNGRFVTYPPVVDLFDLSLKSILSA